MAKKQDWKRVYNSYLPHRKPMIQIILTAMLIILIVYILFFQRQ